MKTIRYVNFFRTAFFKVKFQNVTTGYVCVAEVILECLTSIIIAEPFAEKVEP